jgi:hypothetical protein
MPSVVPIPNTPFEFAAMVADVVVLTLFVPATALSFLGFRLKKKQNQFHRLLTRLGLSEEEARIHSQEVRREYSWIDYVLPVGFATFITFLGSFSLILGGEIFVVGGYNLALHGMSLSGLPWGDDPFLLNEWRRMLAIGFAFLGGFLWSTRELVRRLVTADLAPGTYYGAGLRIVFAVIAAIMLSYLMDAFPGTEVSSQALPVVSFLAGIFPERVLDYLRERFQLFARRPAESSHRLPLEMIEGMNGLHRMRLGEVGIDNAQNLAETDFVDLVLRTPFPPTQILDWIAQAKLFVYFKGDIARLRALGVRSVLDFKAAGGDAERLRRLAEAMAGGETSPLALELVWNRVQADQATARLEEIHAALSDRRRLAVAPAAASYATSRSASASG